VLALMAEGRSNGAIADALVISEGTVEKHVASIFTKLHLPSPSPITAGCWPCCASSIRDRATWRTRRPALRVTNRTDVRLPLNFGAWHSGTRARCSTHSRTRPGELGDTVCRTELTSGAWIDVRRSWMGGADALFDRLAAAVPWRSERRPMYDRIVDVPRLVCFYPEGEQLPDPVLDDAREALDRHYGAELGERFRTAGLCLYRDGRDSVAWHGDTIGRASTEDTMVAIVSLGAPRALLLRPRGGGHAIRHELGHGDLLVMGGSCQRTWEHAVPKSSRVTGARMSVQFRPEGCAEPSVRAGCAYDPETQEPPPPGQTGRWRFLVLLLLCATHQAKNLVSHGHDPSRRAAGRRSRRTDSDDSNVLASSPLRPGPRRTRLADPRPGTCNQILNVRVVNEHVVTLLAGDKAEALLRIENFTVPVANALSLSDRRPQTLRNAPKRLQPTGVAMCPKPNPALAAEKWPASDPSGRKSWGARAG